MSSLQNQPSPSQSFLLQLALRNHYYVNDYIKLADQKAAFVFTMSSGTLVFFYQSVLRSVITQSPFEGTPRDIACILACIALLISALCSIWTVKPRLKPRKPKGMIFWESVVAYENADRYCAAVMGLDDNGVLKELFDHHFQLSKACKTKYDWLKVSIFTGVLGIGVSLLLMAFIKV